MTRAYRLPDPGQFPEEIDEDALRTMDLVARGGSAEIHELFDFGGEVLFKRYFPARSPNWTQIRQLIRMARSADEAERDVISADFAWPLSVVVAPDGSATGVLIPKAPDRFYARLSS